MKTIQAILINTIPPPRVLPPAQIALRLGTMNAEVYSQSFELRDYQTDLLEHLYRNIPRLDRHRHLLNGAGGS
jgi:hypothetical protein